MPCTRHAGGALSDQSAFIVDNVLSGDECAHYIAACERVGYRSLEDEFPREYRSNDRVLTLAPPAVVDEVFARVLSALSVADALCAEPLGPGASGVWMPYGLNECFKMGRYRAGASW